MQALESPAAPSHRKTNRRKSSLVKSFIDGMFWPGEPLDQEAHNHHFILNYSVTYLSLDQYGELNQCVTKLISSRTITLKLNLPVSWGHLLKQMVIPNAMGVF